MNQSMREEHLPILDWLLSQAIDNDSLPLSNMAEWMQLYEQLSTPRQLRRRLRAILHNAQTTSLDAQNRANHKDFHAYLLGMIGFVEQANKGQAMALKEAWSRVKDE